MAKMVYNNKYEGHVFRIVIRTIAFAILLLTPLAYASVLNINDINNSSSDPVLIIQDSRNTSNIEQLNNELKNIKIILSSLEVDALGNGITEQEKLKLQASQKKLSALDLEITNDFDIVKKKIEKTGSTKALNKYEIVVVNYNTKIAAIQNQIDSIIKNPDKKNIKNFKETTQNFAYQPEIGPSDPELPHRIAEPTKKAPFNGSGIVPAYSPTQRGVRSPDVMSIVSMSVSSDLADTIDANQTQDIKNLAAKLDHDPLKMYEYVKDNINYEPYYGSRKGASETLKQMGGNDFDQASLLIALYRTSGIPAKYVYGTVDIPIGKAKEWIGVEDNQTAGDVLATAGVPGVMLISGSQIVAIRTEHVWIEAYVPYTNYRGVPISDTGKMWIPLDPSFKNYDFKEGVDIPAEMGFDANLFLNNYISTMHNESPIELFVKNIENHIATNYPNLTYDDVIRTSWIEPENLGLLPATLPYIVVTVQNEYTEIPDALRDTVRFYIYDGYGTLLDYTARMPEIAGKRVTISYAAATPADQAVIDSYGGLYDTPPYLVDLKPVLKIAGIDTAVGGPIGMGLTHNFDMAFTTWKGIDWIQNKITSGNYLAVGLDTHSVPDAFMYLQPADNESFAGEKLYRTAMNYLDKVDHGERVADETMQMVTVKETSDVIASNDVKVTYMFGTPQTFEWKGLIVDADRNIVGPFAVNGDDNKTWDYMILTGMEGSISENRVFEDNYDVEGISAIKALEIASDKSIQIYDINSSNIGAILPTLSLSSTIKADIQSAVNKGWVVKTPATEFAYKNWTGAGWVKMDPVTGAGGYMISGVTSGGQTVQTWSSQYENVFKSPNVDYITARIISPLDGSRFTKGTIIIFKVEYTVHYKDGSSTPLPMEQYAADTSEAQYIPGEYTFNAGYGSTESIKFWVIEKCAPWWQEQQTFLTEQTARDYLVNKGYHRTHGYACGQLLQPFCDWDYTKPITYDGKPYEWYRFQAVIRQIGSNWTIQNNGPEPNPEVLTSYHPPLWWISYTRIYHDIC